MRWRRRDGGERIVESWVVDRFPIEFSPDESFPLGASRSGSRRRVERSVVLFVHVERLDEVGVGLCGFLFLESLLFELGVDISLAFRLAEWLGSVEGGELRR